MTATALAGGPSVAARAPLWEFVASTGLRVVVSGTSKDPNAKVTLLLADGQGRAALVVKVPTTSAAERLVEAEARVLAELGELLDGPLAETIPRLLGVVEHDGRSCAVMTALAGRPMSSAYAGRRHTRNRNRVASDFDAAAEWLVALHEATAAATDALEPGCGVANRLRERFPASPKLDSDLELLDQLYQRLRRSRTPRTVVHGDFWCGNLLVGDRGVAGVVDWEAATTRGEPVRDFVRFANMYALYSRTGSAGGGWGSALSRALAGDGWFAALYRRFLETGLAGLGADSTCWRAAALAGVAEVAAFTDHDEFARLHLDLFHRLAALEADA